jgi:hypothetical protein
MKEYCRVALKEDKKKGVRRKQGGEGEMERCDRGTGLAVEGERE